MSKRRVHALSAVLVAVLALALLTGTSSAAPLASAVPEAASSSGGSLTYVQVDVEWPNLDPATNPQAAEDETMMGAIYGYLFEQGPHNSVVPDLASGYKISPNGLTVSIFIRHGVRFQDGTAFNAQAVADNIRRVLLPANACICDSDFSAIKKITTDGPYTVVLHLSEPDASIIEAFIESAPNWTVDPTALAKEGLKTYEQAPIGAGPYEVVSNVPNSKLVVKRYPGYWQKGEPHLDSITFVSVGSDVAAYDALQAGTAQVAEGIATQQTIQNAQKNGLHVMVVPTPNTGGIEMNTAAKPFDNIVAREAIYYATNPEALLKVLGHGNGVVTQSPTGPGGSFYEPKVPGYRTYDLAKARALVKQLGGLSTTISAPGTSPTTVQEMEAIASEWENAGIKVKIDAEPLATVIQQYADNSWQTSLAGAGGPDPDIGIQGLSAHVGCHGPLSGVCDKTLDGLIAKSSSERTESARASTFKKIFSLISDKAYEVYLYASNPYLVASPSVKDIQVTDASGEVNVYWESVTLG